MTQNDDDSNGNADNIENAKRDKGMTFHWQNEHLRLPERAFAQVRCVYTFGLQCASERRTHSLTYKQ